MTKPTARFLTLNLRMKSLTIFAQLATAAAAFVLLSAPVHAATIVTQPGVTVTFDTVPDVADWSTSTVAGASGTVTTAAGLDSTVAGLTADSINSPLGDNGVSPPAFNALAQYDSVALNVQTRPTGVTMTPLMATLQNGAGGTITKLAIDYDLGANAPAAEEVPGHRVYFSLDGATWNVIDALSGVGTPGHLSATADFSAIGTWEVNAPFYLLWADDNASPSPDTGFTLDNVHLVPTVQIIVVGRNLIYNRTHTVGGAPNGQLSTSAGNYWLDGATPTAFAATDVANFSQNGNTTIDVLADITTGGVVVSNTTGTYTIGGAGKIQGPFTKSAASTVIFTSANSFSRSTITGGTVETRAGALGSGTVSISNGSIWKVTTAAQTQLGLLDIGTGGATIQTDADLTASGVNGTGLLTKTGTATLSLTGGGGGTGGINLVAGKLSAASDGALGGNTQSITLNGNTLEFTNAADVVFSDGTKTRTLFVGATPATISVTAPGAANPGLVGVTIGNTDTITGSGTITKIGAGALRMRADEGTLTSNWVVNDGTLESGQFTTPLGSGAVTVNTGGRFAGQNFAVPSNVTLAGGELGTRSGDVTDFTGAINVTANSTVGLRSYTTTANGQDITISGVLSGNGGLTVNGDPAGTPNNAKALILSNTANTYTGSITVAAEQGLIVDGSLGATSNVSVNGSMGGKGNIGALVVNAGGTLAPGLSADLTILTQPNPILDGLGILSTKGNVTLAATAILKLNLEHGTGAVPVAGTDYDQLAVGTGVGAVSTGTVTLGGSDLVLAIGSTGTFPTDRFFIIINDGVDPISDTFNNLPDKSFFAATSGQGFQISYNANSTTGLFTGGNDVALLAIPEPGIAGLLLLGSTPFLRRGRRS